MYIKDIVAVLEKILSRCEKGLWDEDDKNMLKRVIYELSEKDPFEIPRYICTDEIMNRPEQEDVENITIDLTSKQSDYKDECIRLSAILDDVARERDELEKELQKTQLKLDNAKLENEMLHEVNRIIKELCK